MNSLSAVQRFIWIDQDIAGNSAKYNIGGYATLIGQLNIDFFYKALQHFAEEQDILRVSFKKLNGEVVQIFHEKSLIKIIFKDFSSTKNANQHGMDWIKNDMACAIDLYREKPYRFTLIKISEDRYLWYAKFHHIVTDGYGISLFFSRIATIYSNLTDNKQLELHYCSYSHFIENEKTYLNSIKFREDKEFWIKKFNLLPHPLFPAIKQGGKQASKVIKISHHLFQKIRDFSNIHQSTEFHYFLAALYLYLSRLRNQSDIVIGIPVANRVNKLHKSTMGTFMNLLPIRLAYSDTISFPELLHEVKMNFFSSFRHQKFQIGHLIQALNLSKKNRLFDVRFSFEPHLYAEKFGNLSTSITSLPNLEADDALAVFIMLFREKEDILIRFDYSVEVFSELEIDCLIENYCFLLDFLLKSDSNIPLKKIQIFSMEHFKRLIALNKPVEYRPYQSIISLFQHVANQYTSKTAIICEDEQLTYAKLDSQSDKLANFLKNYLNESNRHIALVVDRSINMIIAIFGILKAGSTYVPFEPTQPTNRILEFANECRCNILITDKNNNQRFQDAKINVLITIEQVLAQAEAYSPIRVPKETDLAYVICTSGTTGKPKAVGISHYSLFDYAVSFKNFVSLSNNDMVLQQSSIAFDFSIEEIFPILITGGTLIIVSENQNLEKLYEELFKYPVTILTTTPLVLSYINQRNKLPKSLRLIISGGDSLRAKHIDKLIGKIVIYNTYGPTESTVSATAYRITELEDYLPIGQPLANRVVYLLDANEQLVPMGAIGEICIGGTGLATGYINQKELNSEKFINVNFTCITEKLYKTGDLAKWKSDGSLEFIGRKDDQVKIRGYRVELKEIESTLLQHNKIKNAVVLVNTDDDKRIYAYLILKARNQVYDDELREYLASKLPFYMIPHYFLVIPDLPRLPNGKIDKKNLLFCRDNFLKKSQYNDPPKTEVEKQLANIWERLLGQSVGLVNRNDNFFEVGGDSLKAIQLSLDILDQFTVNIGPSEIFNYATLKALATYISQKKQSAYSIINPVAIREHYELSTMQLRIWLANQLETDKSAYNIPIIKLIKGRIDKNIFLKSFQILINRHESLRTVFSLVEGIPKQKILSSAEINLIINTVTLSSNINKESEIKNILNDFFKKPFQLQHGPLLRIQLISTDDDTHLLLMCMPHIIVDGWSMKIVAEEAIAIYTALEQREPVDLLPLSIQYKDYVAWLNSQLTTETFLTARKYWLKVVQDQIPEVALPFDFERSTQLSFDGEKVELLIDAEVTERIVEICKLEHITMNMFYLSIFYILLYKITQQQDITVGTVTLNRNHPQLIQQIGLYVNTLPLRVYIHEGEIFSNLLQETKYTLLNALAHEFFPIDNLIEEEKLNYRQGNTPFFNVLYIYQNIENISRIKAGNLAISEYTESFSLEVSQFDLCLEIFESTDKTISCYFEYNIHLFKKETINKLKACYEEILQEVIKNKRINISEIVINKFCDIKSIPDELEAKFDF